MSHRSSTIRPSRRRHVAYWIAPYVLVGGLGFDELEEVYLYYVVFLCLCELVFFRSYQTGEDAIGAVASARADPAPPSQDPGAPSKVVPGGVSPRS